MNLINWLRDLNNDWLQLKRFNKGQFYLHALAYSPRCDIDNARQ